MPGLVIIFLLFNLLVLVSIGIALFFLLHKELLTLAAGDLRTALKDQRLKSGALIKIISSQRISQNARNNFEMIVSQSNIKDTSLQYIHDPAVRCGAVVELPGMIIDHSLAKKIRDMQAG